MQYGCIGLVRTADPTGLTVPFLAVTFATKRSRQSALSDPKAPNGAIDLSLPPNVRLHTATRTGRGKLLSDFDMQEAGEKWLTEVRKDGSVEVRADDFVHGLINGGGRLLRIETEHGDIRIRRKLMTGLGKRVGREWNEKIGQKLGQQINAERNPGLGEEVNKKWGEKLGREWSEKLNRKN